MSAEDTLKDSAPKRGLGSAIRGALGRYTVLELTTMRAGPVAGRQLADWGANVIKIEMPEDIEAPNSLTSPEFRHGSDNQNLHRNRRCITLNLKTEAGLETLKRMAERADVVIENFRPDVKHRLGFDYEALSRRNPALVYASLSGFGQDGPYAERPGVDQIAQGMSGLMSVTGEEGGRPLRTGIAIADVGAGIFCAYGIVTALLEREHSGRGQWVQTSLLQSLIFLMDFQAARWLQEGEVPEPCGNDHPTIRPLGLFRTSDGFINIAPVPSMWGRLCDALGAPELEYVPDFATVKARIRNSAALNELIEKITAERDSAHWIARFNAAAVPSGPVYSVDQVFADPQVRHLGVAAAVTSPTLGELRQVRQPIDMSRTPSTIWGSAPERGEHNDEVLAEFGFSLADVAALRAEGVV